MRNKISALALSALARWHGTVGVQAFGTRRLIPVRGRMALGLVQRGGRRATWKTAIFEQYPVGADEQFIDIGTSVGQTLLEFRSRSNGGYVGVDPNPAAIAYINELIAANALRDCATFCFAASDQAVAAQLNISANDEGNTGGTLIADLRPTQNDRAVGVATLPLDVLLGTTITRPVRLVKIDVEGAELFVLRGMRALIAAHRPVIVCEVLFADPAADPVSVTARNAEIAEILRQHDYKILLIEKRSETDRTFTLREIEAFPDGILTPDTADLCDYLFIPA